MVQTIADLLVGLGLDMSDLKSGLDEADSLLEGFAGGLNKIGDAATAAFTVPITDGLKDMIGAASNAQDVMALLSIHLQDNQKSAQQAATSVGYWADATSGSTKEIAKLSKEIDTQKEKIAEHMQAWDLETHSANAHDNAVIGMQVHLNALTGQYDAATASTKVWVGANSDGIPVLTTTVDKLEDVAMALEKTTAFSHVNIEAAQAILLTYHAIGNDTFPQATQATLDIAASMGTTATQAALQLGKALDDPVRGITNLRRAGIIFNDSTTQQIKTLMAQNDVLAAQKIILDQVQSQFGGTASAMAQTFAGRLDQLTNAWDDLLIELGTPIINELAPVLQFAAGAVYTFTGALQNSDLGWVVFAAGIAAAVAALGPLLGIVAGIAAPIVAVGLVVGALGLAFATNFGGLKDTVQTAYNDIKPILDDIGNAVNNVLGAIAGPGPVAASSVNAGMGGATGKALTPAYGFTGRAQKKGQKTQTAAAFDFGTAQDSIGANLLGDGGAQAMASQSSDLGTRIKAALSLDGIDVNALLKPLDDIKQRVNDFFSVIQSASPAQFGYLITGLALVGGTLAAFDIAGKIDAISKAILGMSVGPLLPILLVVGGLTLAAATNFGGFADTLSHIKDAIDKIGPVGQAAGLALLGTTLALKLLFGVPLTTIATGLIGVAGGLVAMSLTGAASAATALSDLAVSLGALGVPLMLGLGLKLSAVGIALTQIAGATSISAVASGVVALAGGLMALLFPVLVVAVPLGIIYAYFTDPAFAAGINNIGDAIRNNLLKAVNDVAGPIKQLAEDLANISNSVDNFMSGKGGTTTTQTGLFPGAGNYDSTPTTPVQNGSIGDIGGTLTGGKAGGNANPSVLNPALVAQYGPNGTNGGANGGGDPLGVKSSLQGTIDWLTNIAPPLIAAAATKFMKALTDSITGSATTVELAIELSFQTATTWINSAGVSLATAAANNIVNSTSGIFKTAGDPLVTSVRNALLQLAGMFGAMGQGAGLTAQQDILAGLGKGFAAGGYTGNGPSGAVAGAVHKGEWVVPKNGALVVRDGNGGSSGTTFNIAALQLYGVQDVPSLMNALQKEAGRRNLSLGTSR